MNEEVIISIKANAEPFKQAMKSITNDISLAYKGTEEFSAIIDNASKKQLSDITKNLKNGIKETNTLIQDMQKELVIASQTNAPVDFINQLKSDIGVANKEVVDMQGKLKSMGASVDTGKMSKFFDGIKSKADSLGKSIMRVGKIMLASFAFAAFGTFRKGFQDAIALSDTATAKFSAISTSIASGLVPVIDTLVKAVQTAFIWVAGLIKALTGFNIIQKGIDNTNKKINKLKAGIKDTSKASKGMLTGLDEITNIETDTSSSDTSIGDDLQGQMDSLAQLQSMLGQMNGMDFGWVQPIKDFFQWIVDNWQIVVVAISGIILVFGALKLASMLATVGLTGLTIPLLLIALAITGVIAVVLGVIELFKEGGNQSKAWTLILGGLLAVVIAIGIAFGFIPMLIALAVAAVVAGILWVIKNWDMLKASWIAGMQVIGNFFKGLWDKIVSIFGGIGNWFGDRINDIINFFKKIPSTVGGFFKDLWNNIIGTFTNIGQTVGDAITGALKKAINSVLKTAVSIINGFIKGINFAIGIINKIPGVNITKIDMLDVPSFDVGTPDVPYDMVANIHKGEAIIPEKFNDEKFFNSGETDMSETNSLLQELIQIVINKKTGITANDVGKYAVDYIKTQSRLRGEPVV